MSKISETLIRSRVPEELKERIKADVAKRRLIARRSKSGTEVTESSVIRDFLMEKYGLPPIRPYETWERG